MIKAGFFLIVLFMISEFSIAQQRRITPEEYIEQYKDLAIEEMIKSGVPASIKLAQGILESGSGNSQLSRQANNHFGIKCRNDWQGKKMYYDDDEANECFRVYRSAKDSYRDHSEFLVSGYRYRLLFELEQDDYKGWAKGLRQAGYATNPRYAELLINLIERYKLYQYDQIALAELNTGKSRREIRRETDEIIESKTNTDLTNEGVFLFNGIPAIVVQNGDTYRMLTRKHGLLPGHLARYNDIEKYAQLEPGTILYLKPKRGRPDEPYHMVAVGDDMHSISQMYGVRLKRLYRINLMEQGQEAAAGEKIYLRRRRSEPPLIREFDDKQVSVEQTYINKPTKKEKPGEVIIEDANDHKAPDEKPFVEEKVPADAPVETPDELRSGERVKTPAGVSGGVPAGVSGEVPGETPAEVPGKKQAEALSEAPDTTSETVEGSPDNVHIVRTGETLFSISRNYSTTVEYLMELNKLSDANVQIGQLLLIKPYEQTKVHIIEMPSHHTVKAGETLFSISRQYGIRVEEIQRFNGIEGTDLSVGMVLKLVE